jgi:peptidoglycan/LPS O-acetylase OafA/YrhL
LGGLNLRFSDTLMNVNKFLPELFHMDRSIPTQSNYRPEIDGLRALAIVAVIIQHFNKNLLPSGYLGVDIFFVISGYVITSSLLGRTYQNFGDFAIGFYSRRFKRILPALVVCVTITSILICAFDPDPNISLKTGIAALFGGSNIYIYIKAVDYFTTATELNAFTETWSLGVEEQFYLIFPCLFWLSGVHKQTKSGYRNLIWIVSFISVISLGAYIYNGRIDRLSIYFLTHYRSWELGLGCLVCSIVRQRANYFTNTINKASPVLMLGTIVALFFVPITSVKVQMFATIGVVLLTGMSIATLRPQTIAYNLLTLPLIIYIGSISYSLYLWHWSVLCISRWTIGIHWWSVPLQLITILLLANYSYRSIENPIRRSTRPTIRWKIILSGLTICAANLLLLKALNSNYGRYLYAGDRAKDLELHRGSIPGTNVKDDNCSWYQGFGPNLQQAVKDCALSPKASTDSRKIYIWGDSHAGNLVGLMAKLTREDRIQTQLLYVHGQLAPSISRVDPAAERIWRQQDVRQQIELENTILSKLSYGDIVVISDCLACYFSESLMDTISFNTWLNRLDRLTQIVDKKGAKIVIFLPIPNFFSNNSINNIIYNNCSEQWFRPSLPLECLQSKNRDKSIEETKTIKKRLFGLSQKNSNLFVYDPFPAICPTKSDICSNRLQGRIVYFDSHHLNNVGGNYLYENFLAFLHDRRLID